MPELPEVEIAARNLRRWLAGQKIVAARIPATRILRGAAAPALEKRLSGRKVTAVERRGKWLRLGVDRDWLYSHLGMTGKWVRRGRDEPAHRHERARLDVARASVRYLDPRLFGRLVLRARDEELADWRALGADPLVDGLDADALGATLKRTSRSIKEVLLDQTVIAGVGNIQATEALWRARLHPARRASSLSAAEVRRLVKGIERSIADTLADEEGPEITYVEEPGAPNPFRVYARAGEPCPRCGRRIERIVQAGRSTTLCPKCQPRAGRNARSRP
jgi:formamidopyrimidine-DNA glycosylase